MSKCPHSCARYSNPRWPSTRSTTWNRRWNCARSPDSTSASNRNGSRAQRPSGSGGEGSCRLPPERRQSRRINIRPAIPRVAVVDALLLWAAAARRGRNGRKTPTPRLLKPVGMGRVNVAITADGWQITFVAGDRTVPHYGARPSHKSNRPLAVPVLGHVGHRALHPLYHQHDVVSFLVRYCLPVAFLMIPALPCADAQKGNYCSHNNWADSSGSGKRLRPVQSNTGGPSSSNRANLASAAVSSSSEGFITSRSFCTFASALRKVSSLSSSHLISFRVHSRSPSALLNPGR